MRQEQRIGLEIKRTIKVEGPFRLATSLNVLNRFSSRRRDPQRTARTGISLESPGGAFEIRVRQDQPDADLQLRILGDLATDEVADFAEDRVKHSFSLDKDPTDFFEKAKNDQHLRTILSILPDLRPVRYPTPFEAAVRVIIADRTTPEQAANCVANLREICGIVPAGRPYAAPAFPGKYTLLATPDRLIELAVPLRKVRLIKELASLLGEDPDTLERLSAEKDADKVKKSLCALPGISVQAANQMLLCAYGFTDLLLPDHDLNRAVGRFYKLNGIPDKKTIGRLAEPYIPWRSWWMFMLKTANEISVIA